MISSRSTLDCRSKTRGGLVQQSDELLLMLLLALPLLSTGFFCAPRVIRSSSAAASERMAEAALTEIIFKKF